MSAYERNKGTLIPTGIDTEHYTDDNFDDLYSEGFIVVDGEVYEVEWEIQEDGSISFHSLHYNGGCSLEDMIEDALNKADKKC